MAVEVLRTHPEGLNVLVTGAAGGLGTAICHDLLLYNCTVAAFDLGFGNWRLQKHPRVTTHAFDLAAWNRVESVVKESVNDMGGLDAVVCNAAITDTLHRAQRFAETEWQRELSINLSGAFRVAQAAFPYLLGKAGRIVFVSSVAAEIGQPGQVAYSASKAGLTGMMKTLAVEWAADGITCNVVMPGMIDTPKVKGLSSRLREALGKEIPLRRFAAPEELAGVIAFLLSPAAAYINGSVIRVDGGLGLNQVALSSRAEPSAE